MRTSLPLLELAQLEALQPALGSPVEPDVQIQNATSSGTVGAQPCCGAARSLVVERFHLTKQAIKESDRCVQQSNWNVLGVSIAFLLAFIVLAVGFVIALDEVGLIRL